MTSRFLSRPRAATAATAILFGLLFSGACAGPDPDTETTPDPAASVALDLAAGPRPARPELTEAELEELAASPEVESLNSPFGNAPAPDRSIHVTMSDGTRRAVSLYFPAGFDVAVNRAPVIYTEAWYGRGAEAPGMAIDLYRAAGFVVAITDLRGVGASFGSLPAFMTPEVRNDQRELINWFTSQSWSNGKVAAAGFSISATYAEAMAASGAPALQAAIIRASDFDQYANNVFPGGLPNARIKNLITDITEWMRGEPCIADLAACGALQIPPVDGDTDFRLLQAAFRDHEPNLRGQALDALVYRDDALGTGTVDDMSPLGSISQLRRTAIPARVSGSWIDGTTAESALARFVALPDVAMEVSISAANHSGGLNGDPFAHTPFLAARPGAPDQSAADVDFVRRVLAGQAIGRKVDYYVLGAGTWKSTPVWPPPGVGVETLWLSRSELVAGASGGELRAGQRTYTVDPAASSGPKFSRWASQGGHPVFYGDRRATPGRRLSFDARPLWRDTEIVGAPELCLALRTDRPDGAVFAYLEDVAPDGRVTYLTEGELRLLHRRTEGATRSTGCDPAPGTRRSFRRADGAPVIPGQTMYVEIPLQPTAALIQRGHHLRLSLAGADDGNFSTMTETPATWVVSYGGASGSTLRLPSKAWAPR